MKRILAALFLTCPCMVASAGDAPLLIEASGHVVHAGTLRLPASARYSDASLAASPTDDAYVLGAALLRHSLLKEQVRLKAGLSYGLTAVARRAMSHDDATVTTRATQLAKWVESLPVTGRLPALLDARIVETTPDANRPVKDGDKLIFPARPVVIRVVGAVSDECELTFVPMQDARRYLDACPADRSADSDVFFVIQPDGRVFRQGRALWNRSAPMALAPGAILYVPIRASATDAIDPALNDDMAHFLATQVLP